MNKKYGFYFLFILIFLSLGCNKNDKEIKAESQYIIKSGDIVVLENEFIEALELKKSFYSDKIKQDPLKYSQLIADVINQLSEEVVLIRAAVDKGIEVSEDDLKKEEERIKKDFPDDVFQKRIIQGCIDYIFWKKKLKHKILIERLIQQEVKNQIKINHKKLLDFYNSNYKNKKYVEEKRLIADFYREGIEAEYIEWMQVLKDRYPVEINKERLKSFFMNY